MKNKLCAVKPEEVKVAYQYQKANNVWNFYQEREFIENLCQNRFNYLILLYALFVGVFSIVDKEIIGKGWRALFPVNDIMGIYIPLLMFLSFLAGIITMLCGFWNP